MKSLSQPRIFAKLPSQLYKQTHASFILAECMAYQKDISSIRRNADNTSRRRPMMTTKQEPKRQGQRHVLAWGAMPPNPPTPAKALETLLYYYMKTSWVPVIVTIGPPNIHSTVRYQFLWISLFPLLYSPEIQLEKVSF